MKNTVLLFIAFLSLQFTLLAQEGWFWQNPSPQGNNLNDLHIIDENNIVAFGNNVIIKTSDGGVNWNVVNTDIAILSVYFIDALTGWAGGYNIEDEGCILKTTNGGEIWEIQTSETYKIKDVFFVSDSIGWAVGGDEILKTTNGGETWVTQFTNSAGDLNSLFFIDEYTGWIVGYGGTILKTTNGGEIWLEQVQGYYPDLYSVYFVSNETGFAGGYSIMNCILRTTDGGNNWSYENFDDGSTNSFYFINDSVGWAAGSGYSGFGGYVYKTTDAGINWESNLHSTPFGYGSLEFLNNNIGWLVGDMGIILKTTDGGVNWYEQSKGTRNILHSIQFVDDNTGWAVGEIPYGEDKIGFESEYLTTELFDSTVILKTTNGGDDWSSQFSSTTTSFISTYFTDLNTGWAVGRYSITGSNVIYKTTNGGTDWSQQFISNNQPNFNYVHFINNNNGWVVGNDGSVLKTTNGGENWNSYPTGTAHELTSVFFTDSLNGWVVGNIWNYDDFRIFKSTDSGETWMTQFNSSYYLFDLFFVDSNNGCVVGWNTDYQNSMGVVIRTTNGGEDWIVQEINGTTSLRSVFFTDLNNGWAVGRDLIRTTNGGDTWFIASSPAFIWGNNSIFFSDNNTGWLVGYGGAILKTTDGGVSFVEENEINEMPTEFLLSQNYPNPFNPSTKIKFYIPQTSNTVIKVFDILGNEIETLVNKAKPTGTYELTWNAESLPSGVYFYQLRAGEFIETKKMLLIK